MPNNLQPDSHLLTGKVAMITGSSTGIGRAIALKLASRGAAVILHGRSETDALLDTKAEIEKLGSDVFTVLGDFAPDSNSRFDPDTIIDPAWQWKDGIDIWINNAGGDVLTGKWADKPLAEKLQFLLQVDVTASLLFSQSVGKRMKARSKEIGLPAGSCSIINMGWDQAWQGMEGDSGELFSTTKGSIMSMTVSLAQSLAPAVRVNCIAPGWIKTQWGENTSDYWEARAKQESLMNRWGTPEDVANAAAFLCSDDASFVSGQILKVNGGFRFGETNR